jgi:hypothetical protein
MAYARYVDIRVSSTPARSRPHRGATVATCKLLGRERGGLCDSATVELPARFPETYGIETNDFVVLGYDSDADNHWFHGLVQDVTHNGPGSDTLTVEAVGIEKQLQSIFPKVNYGSDPVNTYISYDNKTTTKISDIVTNLFTSFVRGKIFGCAVTSGYDIDATTDATDITYLVFDGSTSLYEILNSFCERAGWSWGFLPTSAVLTTHTFFSKRRQPFTTLTQVNSLTETLYFRSRRKNLPSEKSTG